MRSTASGGETRRERGIGEDALDDFERARRQAINDLLAEADLWAPGSSSMVPVEAWVLASAAIVPADVGIDRRDLREVWRAVDGDNSRMITQQATKAKAAGTRGWQLYQLGSYGRVARLNRNVEAQYAAARSVYTVAQGSPGDLRGMVRAEKGLVRALNRLVAQPATRTSQAQRLYGLYESLVGKDKAWDLVHTRYPDVPGDSIRPLRSPVMTRINRITRAVGPVASRVMGPVSALMGGYEVITGVMDDRARGPTRTAKPSPTRLATSGAPWSTAPRRSGGGSQVGIERLLEASRSLTTDGVRLELYEAVERAQEPWEFGSFTDEEMHGLDDPVAKSSAYPSPWLSSLNEDEREAATSAALRSLKARRLFDADLVEDAYETWVEPHLAALLTMRRGAEAPLADALGVTSVTRVEVVGERTPSGLGVIVSPEFTVVSQELAEGSTIRYRSVDDAELRSALHTLLRPTSGSSHEGEEDG